MKKIIIASTILIILSIRLSAQNTCADAVVISGLPFSENASICGTGVDYTSGDACLDGYANGEDFVYEFTPAYDMCVIFQLEFDFLYDGTSCVAGVPDHPNGCPHPDCTSSSTINGVCTCTACQNPQPAQTIEFAILPMCPDEPGATCEDMLTGTSPGLNSTGNVYVNKIPLTGGQTYYIVISEESTDFCHDFSFSAVESECIDPNAGCMNNLDFEWGSLDGWYGSTGTCCPINLNNPGLNSLGINAPLEGNCPTANNGGSAGSSTASQHTITTGPGTDPFADNVITVVAPEPFGGDYSLRLGNADVCKGAEEICFDFEVTEQNAGFTYMYAVILENPMHEDDEQPRFDVWILDENGETIECGYYHVVSGSEGTQDWHSAASFNGSTNVLYKDWEAVGADLSTHIGETLTICYQTGDCDLGGHFGYAYIDISCRPASPFGTTLCSNDGEPIELCAPEGYEAWTWSTGETTECITIDNPYEGQIIWVEVGNVVGCESVIQDTITIMEIDAWGDTTVCIDSSFTLYSDATHIADYYWESNPPGYTSDEQNPTFTISEAGTYTFTVYITPDMSNCEADTTLTVIVEDCSNGVSVEGGTICEGDCIDLLAEPIDGTPPFTFVWDNNIPDGAGPHNVCPPVTTVYSVTMTDAEGISSTDNATVTVNPNPVVNVTTEDVLCFGDCNGTATANVSVGTAPYTYVWSDGQVTDPAVDLCPGEYFVTVTDANGCTGTGSGIVGEPEELTLSISSTNISGIGECDATATVTPQGGTTPYSYLWNDPEQQTTQTAVDLCSGDYCVTVTDANGCTDDICVTISSIAISTTSTDLLCYEVCEGTATVTVEIGDPPFSYLWSDPASQTTPTATGLCAGQYSVTVTDANNITATSSVVISQPDELLNTITGTNIACYGGSDGTTDLEVTGGTLPYTYLWNPGGQTTQDLSNIPSGQYDVIVTDANQCTTTATIILAEPPELISTISGTDLLCAGDEIGSANVDVSGGTPPYAYFWQPTDETSQYIDGLTQGEYSVLVTDDNGCTTTNSITIDEPYPVLTQMSHTDLLCFGDVSNGSAGVEASGGTEPYTYVWSNGGNTQTITNIGAGTYYVTATDLNGCTAVDNVTISEPPELIVDIPQPDWICIGESATLIANANGGTPEYNYVWNNGAIEQSNNVSPSVTTGYSVISTDINGCQATANVTLNVYGPLVIDIFPNDTICQGETAIIYANYNGGMGEPYTFTLNGSTTIQTPYTVAPDVTTVYNICITDNCTTPEDCDELEIVVMDAPPVNFIADYYEGCEPLTVHFNETNTHTGQDYIWNFGDPWGSTTGEGKYPVHSFDNPGVYDISCTVTDNYGCTSTWTWYDMIHVYPNPVASFLPYPQVATILKPMIFFENTSSTYFYSHWNFGDGDESTDTHPQHNYDTWGKYPVELAVATEHGCVDTAWTEVIIQDVITFYAPTAFTPDYDQMNPFFSPIGHGIDPDRWYMAVYDRWGEKIYETRIYDVDEETYKVNNGWDGTIKGSRMAESGVYTWLVIYNDISGAEHQHAGVVTLIR